MAKNSSSAMRPFLMSIKPLLERARAYAAHCVQQALAVLTQILVGRDHCLDRVDDAFAVEAGAEDLAQARILRAGAAQEDLIVLDALPIDAQDPDVADMVMAAGVDAARDLDLELAQIVLAL